MHSVSKDAPADAVDDDDLTSELTERPPDFLEIRSVDARHLRGSQQDATPTGLTIGFVHGVDCDDNAHAAVAPHRQQAHFVEPQTHNGRREHHERSRAARIDLRQEAFHAATAHNSVP
jgi:hypothetical protein